MLLLCLGQPFDLLTEISPYRLPHNSSLPTEVIRLEVVHSTVNPQLQNDIGRNLLDRRLVNFTYLKTWYYYYSENYRKAGYFAVFAFSTHLAFQTNIKKI